MGSYQAVLGFATGDTAIAKMAPTQPNACGRCCLIPQQGCGKQLLHLLVDEIRVDTQSATLRGSTAALENAVAEMKMGTPLGVPRFVPDWCARRNSNS